MTTKQAAMDDLPAEMIFQVLRSLCLEDLVQFKLTSKRYLEIVSDFKIKKLKVDVSEVQSYSIDRCHSDLFLVQLTKPTLLHLQHLSIDCLQHFDLNELNCLTRLVSLKIEYELQEASKVCLHLSELRELEIVANQNCAISVRSTKLQTLTYHGGASLLRVHHPENVLTLNTDLPAKRRKLFRNVRYLRSSSKLDILSERTLLEMPDLKEIAYNGSFDDVFRACGNGGPKFLKPFMKKKKALGRFDLKVLFVSFELVDHKPIEDYKFAAFFSDYDGHTGPSMSFVFTHAISIQLIGTYNVWNVDYLELSQAFRFCIPKNFFSKFVGFEIVETSSFGEEELLWFLTYAPELKSLVMYGGLLSESFFHRLSESCSNKLKSLGLCLGELKSLRNLDLSTEFTQLGSLRFEMNLSLEDVKWVLGMRWSEKREFNLILKVEDKKSFFTKYGVMKRLDRDPLYCTEPRTVKTTQTWKKSS